MVLSFLFALIMGFVIICAGIYMLIICIYYAFKPKSPDGEKPKQYVIVKPEETEEEQHREYGNYYGYSYYWRR